MSASERLRALDAPMLMGDPELTYAENARRSFEATLALRNALPEIVAVVEAAEALGDYIIGSKFSMEQPFVSERIRDIRAALTVLEEKLKP